jgi:hypothetical protein
MIKSTNKLGVVAENNRVEEGDGSAQRGVRVVLGTGWLKRCQVRAATWKSIPVKGNRKYKDLGTEAQCLLGTV